MSELEWVRAAVVVLAILAYYSFVVRRLGDALAQRALGAVLRRESAATSYSTAELDGVVRLVLASVMQLAFCVAIFMVSGIALADLLPDEIRPELIAYGLALGVGEAALATHVANVGMRAAMELPRADVPSDTDEWLSMGRGGWMRYYIKTAEIVPLPLMIAITVLYIGVEEIVFRGIVINAFDETAAAIALIASVTLFMVVQLFHMPSWHSAMFAVLGALVIGLVHGLLYLAVPDLTPLIVAHVVLFLATIA